VVSVQGSISLECSDGVAWVHSSFQLDPARFQQPPPPRQPPSKDDIPGNDEKIKDDIQETKNYRDQTLFFDQYGRRMYSRVSRATSVSSRKVKDDKNNARLRSKQGRMDREKAQPTAGRTGTNPEPSSPCEGGHTVQSRLGSEW
jgi:hypothetical protein